MSKVKEYEALIIQNNIERARLLSQVGELELKKFDEYDRLQATLRSAYEKLEAQLSSWHQNYLVSSPISGNVALAKFWSDHQFIRSGEEILTVVPESIKIIGKVELPFWGSGKVHVGQKVRMMFDSYPHHEFGMIIGKVETISQIPVNGNYSLEISLPKGMESTYGKEIVFKQEMQGTADIITEDTRLIERIFNQFKKLLDR